MMKQRSFLSRLIFSYLLIAILPLIVIMAYVFFQTQQTVRNALQERMNTEVELTLSELISQYASMSFISINLVSDQNFLRAAQTLSAGSSSTVDERLSYATVETAICTYAITSSIYDVIYFNDAGYYATSHRNNNRYHYSYRLPENAITELGWIGQIQNNYGQSVLLPICAGCLPENEEQVMALVRTLRNPGKPVGYLVVYANAADLDYILRAAEQFNCEFFIGKDAKEALYTTEDFPLEVCRTEENFLDPELLRSDYLVARADDDETGLSVWMALPMQDVYLQSFQSFYPLILEGLFLLAVVGVVIAVYSRQLTGPLVVLTEMMQRMTIDNLKYTEDPKAFQRYREAAYLYDQFKNMQFRLDDMMQREIAAKTLHMQEQLCMLQTQIHPHFLYNTLNVIGIMGAEEGNDKIYDSCLRLSAILRYSIADRNKNVATFQEEMKNTYAYLELMKLRYEHRFQYDLQLDPGLSEMKVPRLIIQPFVENIFEHAFDEDHTSIRAVIKGTIENSRWYLSIEDNGTGIPDERLSSLREEIADSYRNISEGKIQIMESGIGIRNTLIRMYLFFGESFTYKIENCVTGGARILLSSEFEERGFHG